jgi:hypothetical protein
MFQIVMSEIQIIEGALVQAARRRRLARALRGLWSGLFYAAIVWLVAYAAYKIFPVRESLLYLIGGLALLIPLAGFFIGGWRKPALDETARFVDVKLDLKERLSTALEVGNAPTESTWQSLVLNDAVSHVKEIDARKLIRFSLTRAARWTVLLLALAFGLGFVPEYRSKAFVQKQADAKVIQETGRQLAELTKRDLEQRKPALEPTQKALESVKELGDQLQKQSLTRSEALKDLASAADKLKEQLKDMQKDAGLKKLEQAARSGGGTDSQKTAALQKQMEQLQKQLGDQAGDQEKLEKLQNDLEKLQDAAKAMTDKNSPGNDAQKQQLQSSLASLSKQAEQMGLNIPQLDQALEALAANETDKFIKNLDTALKDLDKLNDMAKRLEQLQAQAQAEKLGKDLAEQLKFGQASAAQQTLEKLSQQLKEGKISKEQLDKMMKEVADAIPQSSEYGKVEDLLKQAAKQMKSGENPGASKSLADAAKELEDLMQQMADAEALKASLANLDTASMCVGTCQSWGMCKGKNPKAGNGGKPGSGVGTWADEDSGWGYDGEWTDRWDNSGITRPDQDGRGHTDRDITQNEGLTPTKVKGQMAPGGQMPSITLKGVSIKGQSKVQYEESVGTAQADAQSALSQEKVPRAYQGAVKDYFDDLKK